MRHLFFGVVFFLVMNSAGMRLNNWQTWALLAAAALYGLNSYFKGAVQATKYIATNAEALKALEELNK